MKPVGLFQHGIQAVYILTKGGVDDVAQFRSELNYGDVTVHWEQKVILYFVKTLLVNSFVAWPMLQCEQYVRTPTTFEGLDKCRDRLGRILLFADFFQ